jgi:hypothetical protein
MKGPYFFLVAAIFFIGPAFCCGILVPLGSIVFAPAIRAQVKHIGMRVEGVTWNFWACGVKTTPRRQTGVQKVEVNLLDGKVDVTPRNDGQIDPAQRARYPRLSGIKPYTAFISAREPTDQGWEHIGSQLPKFANSGFKKWRYHFRIFLNPYQRIS